MSSPNLPDILGKISDGLCVFDRDRKVIFANDKASQILEHADASFHDRVTRALNDNAPVRFEYFHESMKRWFEHQTHPGGDGGLTLVSRDITAHHRLEEALRASEERFRRLMESNIIGMVVVETGVVTEANYIFLKMLGYTPDDVVAKQLRWREMTPPEYDAADLGARHEIEARGVFSPYEKEFIRRNGSRVPVLVGGVATGNQPAETLCLVLDLSERRRAEERIRALVECSKILASSLEYEKTFPEMAEFIAAKHADACIIFLREDDNWARVSAAHRAPATAALEPDPAAIERVLSSGEPENLSSPISRVLVPIIARDKPSGVLGVVSAKPGAFDSEDVHLFTALGRRAGLALDNSRLYREAQKANRLKDEFVAIVSHELRTPLTPILGGVHMLRSDADDRRVFSRALDLIERNAKTQLKIVDDLLDISRALSGKLRLNMEPVDLALVIRSAVETVRPASEAKGIAIDLRLEAIEGVVTGDPDRLQQVVWNLLANSLKFTPHQGHIVVKLLQSAGQAEICVTDTGMGIEAEFLPYVFERFRQADASRTRIHGGLGLGLAIVRHLVESHGGTVHAHSPGCEQGAAFIVRLPLRPIARAAQP
jgi:PAS domain S-box-containing protein